MKMKETTKIIIAFIFGTLVSGVVVYAGVVLSADKVSYDKTTVKDSLDNLFNDSLTGKNNIISALSNKGFNVTNNATYNQIVSSINELPVKLSKDEEGNYGYIITDETGSDIFNLFSSSFGITFQDTAPNKGNSQFYKCGFKPKAIAYYLISCENGNSEYGYYNFEDNTYYHRGINLAAAGYYSFSRDSFGFTITNNSIQDNALVYQFVVIG